MTSNTPPPRLRADVSARERVQIEQVLGPIPDLVVLRAVRDGRGRQFQRMEFLGDSVLDLVLNVHRWVDPGCSTCLRGNQSTEASDHHLAQVAARAGLGRWLEWRASAERLADLVETCVAACWFSAGWPQTTRFVGAVVHPLGDHTLAALTEGARGEPGRAARRVGSAALELAAAQAVYDRLPDAAEGVLSASRAQLHEVTAVARRAHELGEVAGHEFTSRDDDSVLSEVEDLLAETLGRAGADTALDLASSFLTHNA